MNIRERCYRIVCRIFRDEIIRDGFRGILGRDPEKEALKGYKKSFLSLGVDGFTRDLAFSKESWEYQKEGHVLELICDTFRGILKREPENEAIQSYSKSFQSLGLSGLVQDIAESDERWIRAQYERSEELINDLYSGILGKYPEKPRLDELVEKYKTIYNKKINIIVRDICIEFNSEEKNPINIRNVIEGIQTALYDKNVSLNHKVDIEETIHKCSTLVDAVKIIKKSDKYLIQKRLESLVPEEVEDGLKEKLVFLHIDKTAGTTFHEVFKKIYGPNKVLLKHEDPLFKYSYQELNGFKVIGGHLNYDSIRYSRLNRSKIVTFLRDPIRRFESLYNFWRSHDTNHENYVIYHRLADTLAIEDLVYHPRIHESRLSWNHITWAIMGHTLWEQWRVDLQRINSTHDRQRYIEDNIKEKMSKRLNDFYFIGEQEKFDESMNHLLEKLGFAAHHKYERHNDTLDNLLSKRGFKKDFKKIPFSCSTSEFISTSLLELDNTIYSLFKQKKCEEK